MGLAADWEADSMLRRRCLETGQLTSWPSKKTTSIPSMKAAALNARCLELTASWWVSMCDSPATIPIDLLRSEVWPWFSLETSTPENRQASWCRVQLFGLKGVHWSFLFGAGTTYKTPQRDRHTWGLSSLQVTELRKLLNLEEDAATCDLDGWGVKRLFSRILRRWLAKSAQPRES